MIVIRTQFERIYDAFLSQIDDPVFLNADEDDSLKYRYLLNSIPKFKKCRKDLSLRTEESFESELDDEEVMILAIYMVVEYLNPQILSLSNIKQALSSRDFSLTSQANHLEALSDLRSNKKREVDKLVLDYTYNSGQLNKLR